MNKLTGRGPSSDGESAICASSLNTPSPHSRVVERLRYGPDASHDYGTHLKKYQSLCNEAATIISELEADRVDKATAWDAIAEKNSKIAELQAERDRDRLYWNGRCVELQVNGHGWMKAHDQLLGFIQSHPEMVRAMIDEKFAVKYPSPADVPEILQRALAAESSLHRVRAETVEECAKVADLCASSPEEREADSNHQFHEGRDYACEQIATAIRSLTNKTGENDAVKTAESADSPSTLNAETE